MNQYKPGDKVKIISLEKVMSYPIHKNCYKINGYYWNREMDRMVGTVQEILTVGSDTYFIKGSIYYFSPEMIEGLADPVEQEVRKNTQGTGGKPTSLNWVDPEKRAGRQIKQQEGQEEKKWTDKDMGMAYEIGWLAGRNEHTQNIPSVSAIQWMRQYENSHERNAIQLSTTRKNNPQ